MSDLVCKKKCTVYRSTANVVMKTDVRETEREGWGGRERKRGEQASERE